MDVTTRPSSGGTGMATATVAVYNDAHDIAADIAAMLASDMTDVGSTETMADMSPKRVAKERRQGLMKN